MLRALATGLRLFLFVGAFVSFLIARLFLDGGVFGTDGTGHPADLGRSFALSFFAALGLFLTVVALWSYRLESHLREFRFVRLLFARTVMVVIVALCAAALVLMALVPTTAQVITAAGIVLALLGMVTVFVQPKPKAPASAPHRYP